MKKCIICLTEIDEAEEICKSCKEFFGWKYNKDLKKTIEKFKELREMDKKFNLIKFRRKK